MSAAAKVAPGCSSIGGMPIPVMPHATDASQALRAGWLDVGQGHRIRYQESGARDGLPVLLLHGGPGSASSARQRDPYDPRRYRIVQFDQRGCGQSTPLGETAHNHTDALIDDIEALRRELGIARWLVAGGSWGAALALVYAARHRAAVLGLLLRGVFLGERGDLDWFFHGVSAVAPAAHTAFMQALPKRWRRRVVTCLARAFRDPARDPQQVRRLALAWFAYEQRLDGPEDVPVTTPDEVQLPALLARYRVQAHYLAHGCFLGGSGVLQHASLLDGLPLALVHGSHDRVCRPANAWRVHRACVGSRLAWALGAGHHPWHPAAAALLRGAADAFAARGDFSTWPAATEASSP